MVCMFCGFPKPVLTGITGRRSKSTLETRITQQCRSTPISAVFPLTSTSLPLQPISRLTTSSYQLNGTAVNLRRGFSAIGEQFDISKFFSNLFKAR